MIKTPTKREIVLGLMGDKHMTLYDVIKYCTDYKLLDPQSVRNTVNNMYTNGILVKVGEEPKPKEFHTAGKSMVLVYKVADIGDGYKPNFKGLQKEKMSRDARRRLMLKYAPMTLLYAKELKLDKGML
jgi:hypothetical protein